MDRVLERLKTEFTTEDVRYAYADSVTNTFLTNQIKVLREARDFTQEKLAELVGTRQSGISRWQNSGYSSCKVETLRKFAKAFGVRLRISFEEFGTLPSDVVGFTKERLAPRKFDDDPAFKHSSESVTLVDRQHIATNTDLSWLGNSMEAALAPESIAKSSHLLRKKRRWKGAKVIAFAKRKRGRVEPIAKPDALKGQYGIGNQEAAS